MPGSVRRFARTHWKLCSAVALGIFAYLVTPSVWALLTRALVAWNSTVLLLLVSTYVVLPRLSSTQLRNHYEEDDPTAPVILVVVVVAAILSIAAIVAFLTTLKGVAPSDRAAHILLATLTIGDSWLLVPTIYALHYADLYYSGDSKVRPLSFPNTPEPVFWDFAYFSFTIAAACQTADVATCRVDLRKVVLAQSVIAVLFNVSVLGFAVNVTAGLLA